MGKGKGTGVVTGTWHIPHQMAFIVDGLLCRVECLRYAVEQFEKASEAACSGEGRA
jgi:hypothetical protein